MAEQRWVRTINVVALAALLVSSSYCVFYTVLDFGSLWPVVVTNLIWNIGYVVVVVVNGRGNPRVAAWLADAMPTDADAYRPANSGCRRSRPDWSGAGRS